MSPLVFESRDESGTDALGAALARLLPDGTVVALQGPLGAGKTRLVRAIAVASGVPPDEIASPTFVLVRQYAGSRTLYHIDAYRLNDDDEFLALGPEEYFAAPCLVLIEWADRVERCLPRDRVEIRIDETGPTSRSMTIEACGDRFGAVIASLEAWMRTQ